jgi:hypothetical protein
MEKKSGLVPGTGGVPGGMKKTLMTVFQLLAAAALVFAQNSGIPELDEWGSKVLGLITSDWVKAICALAFVIEAGGMIYAARQGEGGTVKKFLPWMIGTIGLLSAVSITDFFFNAS